jgi:hypothetical protein
MIAEVTGWAATGERERPEIFGASDGWLMVALSSGESLSP